MNALEDIWDKSQINIEIIARDDRLKTCDNIKQTKNEWEGEELSAKWVGKLLYKFFKAVVNELNNVLPTLGESVS